MSSSAPTAAAPTRSPWLFGPWVDVLFGYGLLYVVSVPLFLMWSLQDAAGGWLPLALALLISTPHYGATILRVYERGEDRRRYAVFAVWVTMVLVALFTASLYVGLLGSLLLTAYVTWSPWHFSGQNYGLFLMFLRRGGFDPTPLKRPLYASFVVSAGLAILSVHAALPGQSFAIQAYDATGTFTVLPLGVPGELALWLAAAGGLAWAGCLGYVALHLRRHHRPVLLAPLGVLMGMQALWYLPSLAVLTGIVDIGRHGFAFTAVWIATAHAAQYLWVTYYYARREGRTRRLTAFYGKTWLAGSFLLAPTLFLAPGLFGGVAPNTAAVVVLTIAVLNLHHFILDGAIWKLRDGRVARVLLRSERASATPAPIEPGRRLRPVVVAVWLVAGVTLASQAYTALLFYRASGDEVPTEDLQLMAGELAWLGQDTPQLWARVGQRLEEAGERRRAAVAYRRALRTWNNPPPWVVNRMAWLLLGSGDAEPRALRQARHLAEYLVRRLGDSRPEGYQTLAEVHARAGRWEEAVEAANAALRVARAQRDHGRVRYIEQQLERYESREAAASAGPGIMEPAPEDPTYPTAGASPGRG